MIDDGCLLQMVAWVIQKAPRRAVDPSRLDLGFLLLSFLKHFGSAQHLHSGTVLTVFDAEVFVFRLYSYSLLAADLKQLLYNRVVLLFLK